MSARRFVEPDGSPLPILDIKEFHVAAGEQAVLMGKSGCGKTTLLHVIAGISRPDAGVVQIDGCDIARLSEAGRDRFRADKIGYVFQTFNLLPGFSAFENVLLGMSFAGTAAPIATRARRLLDRVGPVAPLDASAGDALGGRAAARGRRAGAGESAQAAVGRRADGECRRRASAADHRPAARHVPGRKRLAAVGHAHPGSGRAVRARRSIGKLQPGGGRRMSLWKIAWRSIQQRALASSLTGISMALGVMLVVAVLVIHGVINQSFLNNSGLGYNMVVGAKGGRLELVLNSVYYLARPVENIPYTYYLEFTEGEFKPYVDKAIPLCLGDMYRANSASSAPPRRFSTTSTTAARNMNSPTGEISSPTNTTAR